MPLLIPGSCLAEDPELAVLSYLTLKTKQKNNQPSHALWVTSQARAWPTLGAGSVTLQYGPDQPGTIHLTSSVVDLARPRFLHL